MTVKEVISVVDAKIAPIFRRLDMVKGKVIYNKLSYLECMELQVIDITVCDNQMIISV